MPLAIKVARRIRCVSPRANYQTLDRSRLPLSTNRTSRTIRDGVSSFDWLENVPHRQLKTGRLSIISDEKILSREGGWVPHFIGEHF
jgi:hypothetical protein